jgi:Predicted Zn-dependent peptidases
MKTNEIITRENKFLKEKYYYIKHDSGLDIYVFPKNLTTSYAVFGTKYGSIDNKFRLEGEADYTVVPDGIAHYLEHKMFENEDGEDTFAKFARTGASANAYTSFNMTVYLYSCTSMFYESLDILLEYVTHPYLTPENVEKERGIIAQEIRMGEDSPGRAGIFDLLQAMYEKHNVRIDIAGTVESIGEIDADILYKCYNTFYNLSNMALCVCGDVDPEKVIEAADRMLEKQSELKIESVYAVEDAKVFKPYFTRKMQVSKPMFNIGVKDVAISDDRIERMKKSAAMNIMTSALFSRSGKFYNELYSDGLISNSFGWWSSHNQAYSYIALDGESKDPDEVFKRFKEYIKTTQETGIDKAVFERCKRVLFANSVKGFDSTEDIANNFLEYIFEDADIFEYIDIISNIEYDYVAQLLNDMYKEDYYSFTTIYPLDGEE